MHTAKQGAEGQGWGDCAFRKGKGSCKRGSEDVLLIEVAPGLFTGFWESRGESCCYSCWWDLKVLWREPCRTGEEMLGKQVPPGMPPLASVTLRSHYFLALTVLFSADTLANGVLETWGAAQRLRMPGT